MCEPECVNLIWVSGKKLRTLISYTGYQASKIDQKGS